MTYTQLSQAMRNFDQTATITGLSAGLNELKHLYGSKQLATFHGTNRLNFS